MRVWSTKEAAERLGVSVQRIRALASAGRLKAGKVGAQWVVEKLTREIREPRPGRPLSSRSAWALLAELCGVAPDWIHASALSRLRRRLRDPEWSVRALLYSQPRAEILRWRALPSDLHKIRREAKIIPSGLSALSSDFDIVPAKNEIARAKIQPSETFGVFSKDLSEKIDEQFHGLSKELLEVAK